MLLDSGATYSVMLAEYFQLLTESCRSQLKELPGVGRLGDGGSVKIYGEMELVIRRGDTGMRQTSIVRDIAEEEPIYGEDADCLALYSAANDGSISESQT